MQPDPNMIAAAAILEDTLMKTVSLLGQDRGARMFASALGYAIGNGSPDATSAMASVAEISRVIGDTAIDAFRLRSSSAAGNA
jgi:hypothetical protein